MPNNSYKILFTSSEVVPFAKTGGLADVAGALPKELGSLGHDVKVVMPLYKTIQEAKFGIKKALEIKRIDIPLGGKTHRVKVKTALIPESNVSVYFVDYPRFFNTKDLYTDPKTGDPYANNDARFLLLSRAVLEISKALNWGPDIIHCNDWQTATIPLYLKTFYRDDPSFSHTRTVLSIHNLGYQGNFPPTALKLGGFPEQLWYPLSPVEFYDQFSFLKSGIMLSDIITTVSEKYAEEIQSTSEYGFGLEGVLRDRTVDLHGILNGIDTDVWSPQKDTYIFNKFSSEHLEGKEENKRELLKKCGLNYDSQTTLIGIISRLADQKGFDLIAAVFEDIAALEVQMVILGTGERKYHDLFKSAADKYPQKFSVHLTFDNQLAHQIEAGSDFFLMPSRYEPCGLNQMYSLMYGTIPIVRATGGLADTVKDIEADPDSGTGFSFEDYDAKQMLETIKRALTYYKNGAAWRDLQKRGMAQDFSWARSAEKYIEVYKLALSK